MIYARACEKLPLKQCQSNASAMLAEMRNLSFVGKSGLVTLDENEDRIPGSVAFQNYWLNPSDSCGKTRLLMSAGLHSENTLYIVKIHCREIT